MNQVTKAVPVATLPRVMTLAGIRKGKIKMPMRVLIYGAEGCGKTTFCAGAPKPILIGVDSGSMGVEIDRLPEPRVWQDVLDAVALLENEKHDYESIVIDPANWAESLIFQQLTNGAGSIEDFGGGYGKGYTAALEQWRILLSGLERLWRGGMHVLLTAHAHIKPFANPEGASFDRYEIAMNAKAAGLLKQWTDFVLFARFEAFAKLDPLTKKSKGVSTGARVIHSAWTAAFDAKSRVTIPDELPLSWQAFREAVDASISRPTELRARIEALLTELCEPEAEAKVRAYLADAKDDANRLDEIMNAIVLKLQAKKEAT